MKVRRREVLICHSVFHLVSAQHATLVSDLEKLFKSFSTTGTKGCLDLSSPCSLQGGDKNLLLSMCSGSCARRARDSMTRLRRSSVGKISAKTNKLSIGVRRRHPVTMRKASLIGLLMSRVWALRHQTGKQYSAAEWLCAILWCQHPRLIPPIVSKSGDIVVIF